MKARRVSLRPPRRARRERRRGGGFRRLFLFVLLLLIGGLVGGFITFARHVDALGTNAALIMSGPGLKADGIVVWTGKGGGRLETAGALLEAGEGERLLVSGVNRTLSVERVASLAKVSPDRAACCLDVDYAALDTRGNALETAHWAEALGYDHIVLVTSAYHMPRARVELGQSRPGLRVTPVAVRASDPADWWRDGPRFRRLSGEYGKYLLSVARGRTGARRDLPETSEPLPERPPGSPPDQGEADTRAD